MSTSVTIRDVPEDVHDEMAARATRAGQSLQQYLRSLLIDAAARPTANDVIARTRERVNKTGSAADAESILAARDVDRR